MKKLVTTFPNVLASAPGEEESYTPPKYRSVRLRHPSYEVCANGIYYLLMPEPLNYCLPARKRIENVFANKIVMEKSDTVDKGERS
jgi:hypothetical protein